MVCEMVFTCGQTSKTLNLVPCHFVGQVFSSLHCSIVGKVTSLLVNTLECCEDFKNKTLSTQLMIDWHGHWGNPSQKKTPFLLGIAHIGGTHVQKDFDPFCNLKNNAQISFFWGLFTRWSRHVSWTGCSTSTRSSLSCWWVNSVSDPDPGILTG